MLRVSTPTLFTLNQNCRSSSATLVNKTFSKPNFFCSNNNFSSFRNFFSSSKSSYNHRHYHQTTTTNQQHQVIFSVGASRFSSKRTFFVSSTKISLSQNNKQQNPEEVDDDGVSSFSAEQKLKDRRERLEHEAEKQEAEKYTAKVGSLNDISPVAVTVSRWLFFCAGIVFTIIVVGGITRLTESGLSIVEWKPVAGMIPPLTQKEWEDEFAKYQKYPEYAQNADITLNRFKYIFFWEWFHRVLARTVGIVYAVPFGYFLAKGYFKGQPKLLAALLGMFALGGAQGALGWYMVKSGLDPKQSSEHCYQYEWSTIEQK